MAQSSSKLDVARKSKRKLEIKPRKMKFLVSKPSRTLSIVGKLQSYLQTVQDPTTKAIIADKIVKKYVKMALAGDPIIMRDLINRIDGLPKQHIINDNSPVNINVITSLFGEAIRPLKQTPKEYSILDTSDEA